MPRPDGSPTVLPALASQHMVEPFTDSLGERALADLSTFNRRHLGRLGKRGLDVAVAGIALALLLPLLLLVGAAVWAGDRKSPIFRHTRLGRGGRTFGCLKFRTMVVDSEARLAAHLAANPAARAEWEATHKLAHDPG